MIEMELNKIIIDEKRQEQIIVLKEKTGERLLPIIIGLPEASSIKMKLSGVDVPRPMTHDLIKNVIDAFGARVEKILIDNLLNITKEKINIKITGHSLGGVMSSTFCLFLHEKYNNKKNISIKSYSFAAPTAGNNNFAAYSDSILQNNCERYINKLDIVPMAWEKEKLEHALHLYPNAKPSFLVKKFIIRSIKKISDKRASKSRT